MQPAADEDILEPDFIIPWPVAGAAACMLAAIAINIVFAQRFIVAPDLLLSWRPFGNIFYSDTAFRHAFIFNAIHNEIAGPTGMLGTSSLALIAAFAADMPGHAFRNFIYGPLPQTAGRPINRKMLVPAEILIGCAGVLFALSFLRYPDFGGGDLALHFYVFRVSAIGITGFWAVLADTAWYCGWRFKYGLGAFAVAVFFFDLAWQAEDGGVTVSVLMTCYLLGATMFFLARLVRDRYAV